MISIADSKDDDDVIVFFNVLSHYSTIDYVFKKLKYHEKQGLTIEKFCFDDGICRAKFKKTRP